MTDVWSTWRRLTLAAPIELAGIGLHSGEEARVRVVPGARDSGIELVRVDAEHGVFGRVAAEMVVPGPLCTLMRNGAGVTVSTTEHLMAALAGMGVGDVRIEVEGGEVPILDGSSRPWVDAILAAGVVDIEGDLQGIVGVGAEVGGEKARQAYVAGEVGRLEMKVSVDFDHPMIGRQVWDGEVTPKVFMDEISYARSFILEKDIPADFFSGARTLMKGASLATGVLFGNDNTVINPEGLRFADEPVRHKVLDAIGDLALAGGAVPWGRYELERPGHVANNALLRAMTK